MSDWFILRTAGRDTLRLAKSLTDDGFGVWTPAVTKMVRQPRLNAKRKVILSLLPSFVFAKGEHLIDLTDLSLRRKAHRGFSIFRWQDHIPMVRDEDLEPLRQAETMVRSRRKIVTYSLGSLVRAPEGGFGGMIGVVEESNGRHTLVCFNNLMRVKIHTWLLKEDQDISFAQVERVPRHRNAAKYLGRGPNVGKVLLPKCEACADDTSLRNLGAKGSKPPAADISRSIL